MSFSDFDLTAEERRVITGKFVTHLDREVYGPCVKTAFVFRNLSAAAVSLPPVTLLNVLISAVKFHPRPGGQRVFHVELAAACNWAVHAELHARHPTPIIVIAFVDVECERGDLDGVFRDGWLVLRCACKRVKSNHNEKNQDGIRKPKLGFHGRGTSGVSFFWAKRPRVYYDARRFVKTFTSSDSPASI